MKRLLVLSVSISMLLAWAIHVRSGSTVEADTTRGRSVYAENCLACHGVDGKGGGYTKFTPPVADLTSPAVKGRMDMQLFRTIHDGKPNTAMGAWQYALSDQEIRDVLSYVRTLGTAD